VRTFEGDIRIPESDGRVALALDRARRGPLRIFVDDSCLGQTTLPADEAIKGIRVSVAPGDGGKLWIDDLVVTRRLPSRPRPSSLKNQDLLWLAHGEEIFGHIVAADAQTVTLDAKFGARVLAWPQLRGIFFAQPKPMGVSREPEITFRPDPGFPLDRLRAKLLRWEGGKLIVEHNVLGEVAVERERLDKIRFEAK